MFRTRHEPASSQRGHLSINRIQEERRTGRKEAPRYEIGHRFRRQRSHAAINFQHPTASRAGYNKRVCHLVMALTVTNETRPTTIKGIQLDWSGVQMPAEFCLPTKGHLPVTQGAPVRVVPVTEKQKEPSGETHSSPMPRRFVRRLYIRPTPSTFDAHKRRAPST